MLTDTTQIRNSSLMETTVLMNIIFRFCLLLVLTYANPIFSAGPIVHAYLTHRFFEHYPKYDIQEKHAFMVGTLFPDIQYMGEAGRECTHCETRVSLEEVLNEPSPFMAGVKFHCYVDWVREDFVAMQKMYDQLGDLCPEQQQIIFLKLKLMEDEVVFTREDWTEWCRALKENYPEELNFGVTLPTVQKWHNILDVCFTNPPSTLIFLLSISNVSVLNIPSDSIIKWNKGLKPTANSVTVRHFVNALLAHFEIRMDALPCQ